MLSPPRTEGENMGIGLGIVLLVIGLILVTGVVNFDIGFVDDQGLGWILLIVGVLAIVLALVMNQQRSRTKHVEERRYDGPPAR
jgi:cell division protein FtsW (lipid II flippase)